MFKEWPSQENKEIRTKKRMPITVETDNRNKNVWVDYETEVGEYVGTCMQCKKENQSMKIEKLVKIKVDSDDPKVISQAEEKLKIIVDTIERDLAVCGDCYGDGEEFKKKLPELYIAKLEELQERMGIEIDKEKQRGIILGNLKL